MLILNVRRTVKKKTPESQPFIFHFIGTLKCPYDQIFDIHFFYIFVHNRSSLDILLNFNLYGIERTFFGPLFP